MAQHPIRSPAAKRLRAPVLPLRLEPLEQRQLLSAAVSPTWTINGTDAPDVIAITYNPADRTFSLTLNGITQIRPASKVQKFVINGLAGDDTLSLNTGTKTTPAIINGGDGNDTLTGGTGNDILNGGAGEDTINGGAGNDIIIGGDGADHLNGNTGNDSIQGNAGDDTLNGGTGNDVLSGGAGNDSLNGDDGNDRLLGGDGDDLLTGGAGRDSLDGGTGADTLYGFNDSDSHTPDHHDSLTSSLLPPGTPINPPTNPPSDNSGSGTLNLNGGSILTIGGGTTVTNGGILTLGGGTTGGLITGGPTPGAGTLTLGNGIISSGTSSILLGSGSLGNVTLQSNPLPTTLVSGTGTLTLNQIGLSGASLTLGTANALTLAFPSGTQLIVTLSDDQFSQVTQIGTQAITGVIINNPIIDGSTLRGPGQVTLTPPP